MKKKCVICGKVKEISYFHKKTSDKYGVRNQCKECRREYYINNADKEKERVKKWNEENPEKNRERARKYYYKNREKALIKQSEYAKKNRTHINATLTKRRKKDINYKISCYLRNRLVAVLKGAIKTSSVMNLIGCDIEYLKKHIEKKFTIGMGWDNYGKWHIDHIVPCVKFNMAEKKAQKKCFNYSNLQPLWAYDNFSKGASI